MFKKILKALDYGIIIISLILFSIGIVALYSANGGAEGDTAETVKQIAWMAVGVVTMIIVIFIDYKFLRKTLDFFVWHNNDCTCSSTFY